MTTTSRRPTRGGATTTAILAGLGVIVLVTGTTGVWTPGRLGVPATGGFVPGLFLNYQQLVGVALIVLSTLICAYALGRLRRQDATPR